MFQTLIRQDRAFRKIGVEKGETIFKGGKAPAEAVSGPATYIQQRTLYCTQAWPRAFSESTVVHRDESVLTMLFVTVHTIA